MEGREREELRMLLDASIDGIHAADRIMKQFGLNAEHIDDGVEAARWMLIRARLLQSRDMIRAIIGQVSLT